MIEKFVKLDELIDFKSITNLPEDSNQLLIAVVNNLTTSYGEGFGFLTFGKYKNKKWLSNRPGTVCLWKEIL